MCIFIFTHVHVCVLFVRVENVVLSAKLLSMALLSQHKYLIERIYIFCCTHLTTCCCLCVYMFPRGFFGLGTSALQPMDTELHRLADKHCKLL